MAEDPARLAAIDQQLAELDGRLGRKSRDIMTADALLVLFALAGIIYNLVTSTTPSRWDYLALWVIIATLAGGGIFHGLTLRNYRAEIRDLRARVTRT